MLIIEEEVVRVTDTHLGDWVILLQEGTIGVLIINLVNDDRVCVEAIAIGDVGVVGGCALSSQCAHLCSALVVLAVVRV